VGLGWVHGVSVVGRVGLSAEVMGWVGLRKMDPCPSPDSALPEKGIDNTVKDYRQATSMCQPRLDILNIIM